MKGRRIFALLLSGCLLSGLAGCGSKADAVFVQSVDSLMQMGGIAPGDHFAGLVVSEKTTEIKKDKDKSVEELAVREGDDVKQGQKLFTYDTEQLQLALEKQKLEQEQMIASIASYTEQIAELEETMRYATPREKLQYTIQIQTNQVDLMETQIKLKNKEDEVAKSEELLKNATVSSPVNGRVTSINESSMDNEGKEAPYITIQQTGAYRVKGMLNELQRGGLMEGDRVKMESRVDPSATWTGTVTLVDYESPVQGTSGPSYMETDEMSSSSRYPFYVALDSIDGILMGQHLYTSLDTGESEDTSGVKLGSSFILFDDNQNPYVWAENSRGKLEKRMLTLGEYDPMRDVYAVLSGLTADDYVAFPDEEHCHAGVPATRTKAEGGVQ